MAKIDLLTIGGTTRDVTFYSDEGKVLKTPQDLTHQKWLGFEYGAKISIENSYFTFGGGATNVAVGARKLGLKTACLVRVGNCDYGKMIINNLKDQGVRTDWIQEDNKNGSGFSFIIVLKQTGEHTAFLYRGANNFLHISQSQIKKINPKWIFISSLSGDKWQQILNKVIFEKQSYQIAWNPGGKQIKAGYKKLKKYLKLTSVLFINKDEAIELVLSTGIKTNNIKNLTQTIYKWGVKNVVIGDGVNGAYAYDGQKLHHQKVRKIKVQDTTGAGDALAAGFISQWFKKSDIGQALKVGSLNSQSILKKVGAQQGLLTKNKLKV